MADVQHNLPEWVPNKTAKLLEAILQLAEGRAVITVTHVGEKVAVLSTISGVPLAYVRSEYPNMVQLGHDSEDIIAVDDLTTAESLREVIPNLDRYLLGIFAGEEQAVGSAASDAKFKPILYLDMDNTLVDFQSAFPRMDAEVLEAHPGHKDDIPHIFGLMEPMPGAIEAVHELARHFDVFVLSTAPWANPTAWHDKVQWIKDHFGAGPESVLYKRLILSHHKHLNRGDFLVDDRPEHNGAQRFHEFGGEVIHFGVDGTHKTWPEVVEYLKSKA